MNVFIVVVNLQIHKFMDVVSNRDDFIFITASSIIRIFYVYLNKYNFKTPTLYVIKFLLF